jgi:DNA-binding beta-propeller fold protein YncE
LKAEHVVHLAFSVGAVASGDGALWLATASALVRLNPTTLATVATIPLPGAPQSIAVGASGVWVAVLTPANASGFVVRIDPRTNRVAATINLGYGGPEEVLVGSGTVWVSSGLNGETIYWINPTTDRVVTSKVVDGGSEFVEANGLLFVDKGIDDSVAELNARSGSVVRTFGLSEQGTGVLDADGYLWVAVSANSMFGNLSVARFDASSGVKSSVTIPNQQSGGALVSAFGRVWVLTSGGDADRVEQIDPATGKLIGRAIALGGSVDLWGDITGDGPIWAVSGGSVLTELASA